VTEKLQLFTISDYSTHSLLGEQIKCNGSIEALIQLRQSDFTEEQLIIEQSSAIFFNNFGPWFTPRDPGKDKDLLSIFQNQVTTFFHYYY
jgi:hypothetical protein